MESKYILMDTVNDKALSNPITLSDYEVKTLNYAYALNGVRKKYVKV